MLVIGLAGQLGAGKDYLAMHRIMPYLQANGYKSVIILAFADPLKAYVMAQHNLPFEHVYTGDKSPEVRLLLQQEGSKRNAVALSRIALLTHQSRGASAVVFSDVRFPAEVALIREEFGGKVFRVSAPNRTAIRLARESKDLPELRHRIMSHPSEVLVKTLEVDGQWPNDGDKFDGVDLSVMLSPAEPAEPVTHYGLHYKTQASGSRGAAA